jgi:ParB-like chromosome segregation protein Spo0J
VNDDDKTAMRIEYVALGKLKGWPRNPKQHELKTLERSFQRFGFVMPPMIDETSGQLVAGHGRIEGLLARKASRKAPPDRVEARADDWYVPVLRGVAFKNETEAQAYLLADNRIQELAGYNKKDLDFVLEAVADSDEGLDGTGFTADDISSAFQEVATVEEVDVSDASEAQFFLSVRGPLPAQPDALDKLREALASLPNVTVKVGLVE